jgi:hypothetical protein
LRELECPWGEKIVGGEAEYVNLSKIEVKLVFI